MPRANQQCALDQPQFCKRVPSAEQRACMGSSHRRPGTAPWSGKRPRYNGPTLPAHETRHYGAAEHMPIYAICGTMDRACLLQSRIQPAAPFQRFFPRDWHQPSAAPNPVADLASLFGGDGDSTDPFTLYGTVRWAADSWVDHVTHLRSCLAGSVNGISLGAKPARSVRTQLALHHHRALEGGIKS